MGAEWLLVLVMVRLLATLAEATKVLESKLGREVGALYLSRVMVYS